LIGLCCPWAWRGETFPIARRLYDGNLQYDFNPRDLAHLSDLYDEEITYFDEQFAKLIGDLRDRRLLDRTVIVLAADHGEEMYEHGQYGHCRSLAYETVLRTPLLMRIPGVDPGRRQALVDNLDVVPTVEKAERVSTEEATKIAKSHILPGVLLQPSGVFAATRAQEAGCTYLKAS